MLADRIYDSVGKPLKKEAKMTSDANLTHSNKWDTWSCHYLVSKLDAGSTLSSSCKMRLLTTFSGISCQIWSPQGEEETSRSDTRKPT